MVEDRHHVAPTETGSTVMARRSNHRSASSRVPRNMAIGVGIVLILALIEGAVWLLAFSGGGTHNISTFLSSAAHTPLFLFVLLLQLMAACILVQVTDRPLALLRYIREVQRAQEQYRAFYTPANSWPAVYETTIMYVQDSPDPSVPGQVQSMSMSELAQHLAPTSAAGQAHQLILGAPGAGKTMLLRLYQYVALQQGRALIAGRAKIPIFVSLRDYSFYREVASREPPQLAQTVAENLVARVQIVSLDGHQVCSFVERFIEEQDPDNKWRHTAGQVMEAIDRSRLRDYCTNPLMLFCLMEIVDEIGVDRGKQLDTRGQLFRAYVRYLIQR